MVSTTSEKYECQMGLLFPIYGEKMFQTTNQIGSDKSLRIMEVYVVIYM